MVQLVLRERVLGGLLSQVKGFLVKSEQGRVGAGVIRSQRGMDELTPLPVGTVYFAVELLT